MSEDKAFGIFLVSIASAFFLTMAFCLIFNPGG